MHYNKLNQKLVPNRNDYSSATMTFYKWLPFCLTTASMPQVEAKLSYNYERVLLQQTFFSKSLLAGALYQSGTVLNWTQSIIFIQHLQDDCSKSAFSTVLHSNFVPSCAITFIWSKILNEFAYLKQSWKSLRGVS